MHPAIELLIARMKSNPEEFIRGKWDELLARCERHATELELIALRAAHRRIALDSVHRDVMKQLIVPEQLDLFTGMTNQKAPKP
jgi:hypothetical protein